jgi:hypothetical protein
MQSIVSSIPKYIEMKLNDMELSISQAYLGDQLTAAQVLIKAGHIRAAGAVAGVLLERHLKMLCDHHGPPIKYKKADGISALNNLLKNTIYYDTAIWRKVQWMGDVRNSCDHARTPEPRKEDVSDLIEEVKKFITLFTVA